MALHQRRYRALQAVGVDRGAHPGGKGDVVGGSQRVEPVQVPESPLAMGERDLVRQRPPPRPLCRGGARPRPGWGRGCGPPKGGDKPRPYGVFIDSQASGQRRRARRQDLREGQDHPIPRLQRVLQLHRAQRVESQSRQGPLRVRPLRRPAEHPGHGLPDPRLRPSGLHLLSSDLPRHRGQRPRQEPLAAGLPAHLAARGTRQGARREERDPPHLDLVLLGDRPAQRRDRFRRIPRAKAPVDLQRHRQPLPAAGLDREGCGAAR